MPMNEEQVRLWALDAVLRWVTDRGLDDTADEIVATAKVFAEYVLKG